MHSRQLRAAAFVLALGSFALPPLAGRLTPEIVVDMKQVTDVALDPAGLRVVYTLRTPRAVDDDPGGPYSHLWIVGDETDPRQFTSGKESVSAPEWSPDGKLITFLLERAAVHESAQVFAIPADGGEAKALTSHASSVALYRWSPSGQSIAFVAPAPKSDEKKEAEKAGRDWKVDGDLHRRELWLFDVTSGEEDRIETDLQVWSMVWAPDGKTLVVQASAEPRTDDSMMFSGLHALSIAGGSPRKITNTEGKLGAMEVSPDGKRLAFLGAVSRNDPLAQSLFVVPMSGGDARNLTDRYEGSAFDLAWLDDRTLLLATIERERHRLYRVDAASGERTALPWGDPIVHALSVRPSAGRLAAAANTASHPDEVFLMDLGSSPARRTYHNPALDDATLARQEVVRWTGATGWEIGGVLTYPLDYKVGRRYPLILQIHGGPEGVSLDGWVTGPLYPVQLLAAEGFMVLQPNYRGSAGRGVAFSKADHDDLGGSEFDDVLAGVDALAERGLVDGNRVGTGGWSYGGYFSAWAATRHSERFKASIVAAGLTNWISFAGTTDIPYEMSLVHWDSWWQDRTELHWQRSPLAHIGKAATPTLVVHGEKDERVHPEQGIQLHTALRIKGVPTSLVLYPREPHGLNERAHQLDFIERTLDWFETYVRPTAAD